MKAIKIKATNKLIYLQNQKDSRPPACNSKESMLLEENKKCLNGLGLKSSLYYILYTILITILFGLSW